jgi:hypothetical protein
MVSVATTVDPKLVEPSPAGAGGSLIITRPPASYTAFLPRLEPGKECRGINCNLAYFSKSVNYRFQKDISILNWHYDLSAALLNIS